MTAGVPEPGSAPGASSAGGGEAALAPDRIRHAATVIIVDRDRAGGPAVLMGMRGAAAAFMPSKYVFPGGAVDPEDAATPCPDALSDKCRARLTAQPVDGTPPTPDALARAASTRGSS